MLFSTSQWWGIIGFVILCVLRLNIHLSPPKCLQFLVRNKILGRTRYVLPSICWKQVKTRGRRKYLSVCYKANLNMLGYCDYRSQLDFRSNLLFSFVYLLGLERTTWGNQICHKSLSICYKKISICTKITIYWISKIHPT